VSQEPDVRAFVEWAHASMGGLNAVINNAGILRDGLLVKKDRHTGAVTVLPKDQWDAVLAVNLTGATLLVREGSGRWWRPGPAGAWWSACPASPGTGNRGQSNYVAAKAALAANTFTWAREFAPFGVRATAVARG
jgi:3-oxoacyl-[acyl-carrier protein] reductase